MEQEFFIHLPTEIITDILSRLPVRSIVSSKCVCKSWLHLLKTDEFVNSHLAKSVPMLAALMPKRDSSLCTVIEFEDELDLEGHDLHYNPLSIVDVPHGATIQGSVNGLLLPKEGVEKVLKSSVSRSKQEIHVVPFESDTFQWRLPLRNTPKIKKVRT